MNQYDIEQIVLVKKDYPEVELVISGGKEAPYVSTYVYQLERGRDFVG